ncbi:MAG: hypothetical protein ABIO72_00830 [Patescibacteria group bacterium]
MTLESTRDILFIVLAVATGFVAIALCWALFELATLLRKANRVVQETEQKIIRIEHGVMALKERVESSVNYLGILAEGGKAVMSMLKSRFQHDDEESDDDMPKKKKKSKLFDE